MVDERVIQQMRKVLGLTKNESKIYFFLLKSGMKDPSEISEELDLPKSRIYENLAKLASKNILKKRSDRFGYEIISPTDAIDDIKLQKQQEYSNLKSSLEHLGSYLNDLWKDNLVSNVGPGVQLLPYSQSESLFLEDISNVRNRIFIAVSSNVSIINWQESGKALSKAMNENLSIRYLVNTETLSNRLKLAFENFEPFNRSQNQIEVGFNPNLHISFVLIDNLSYIFFFGSESATDAMTLRTADKNFSSAFEWKFSTLWESSS